MNIRKSWMITGLALLIALGSSAAPITFNITGTADSTAMGYTAGQSYAFTWALNDSYSGSSGDTFTADFNLWQTETTSDPLLFTSFSGDGLVGTYSRPAGGSPYEGLQSDDVGLSIFNGDLSSSSIGLTANGVDVWFVEFVQVPIPGLTYADTSFQNPATWAGNYLGTYNSPGGSIDIQDVNGSSISFTPTSLVVIPEPASIALLGMVAGAGFFIRRIIM